MIFITFSFIFYDFIILKSKSIFFYTAVAGIKKYITFLFIPIVLFSSVNLPLVYLEFELNKGYITKVLCLDRDKPVNVCSGSCFLKKRLEKEATSNTTSNSKMKRLAFTMFYQNIKAVFVPKYDRNSLIAFSDVHYCYAYSKSVFHPPNFPLT